MVKLLQAYVGEDFYNHEESVHRYSVSQLYPNAVVEPIIEELKGKLVKDFVKKRWAWYHIYVIEMSPEGVNTVSIASEYAKLKQRIILNEEAKPNHKDAPIPKKPYAGWAGLFNQPVIHANPAAFFAPPVQPFPAGVEVHVDADVPVHP
jgi:hypothetical protein